MITIAVLILVASAIFTAGYCIGAMFGEAKAYDRYVYEENRSPNR